MLKIGWDTTWASSAAELVARGVDDPCRTITPVPTGGSPMGTPLPRDNGRTLTDEASDAFLAILTNRKVTEDKVGPTAICSPSSPTWGRRQASEFQEPWKCA